MSLVGPRPHAVAHNSEFEKLVANYAFRHHVKPGITGWAQVNGYRGETPTTELMAKRVELDLWYINNWSIWTDIKILLRTLIIGFSLPPIKAAIDLQNLWRSIQRMNAQHGRQTEFGPISPNRFRNVIEAVAQHPNNLCPRPRWYREMRTGPFSALLKATGCLELLNEACNQSKFGG